MNEVEQGIPDNGIAPKLIQQFGGYLQTATDAYRPMTDVLTQRLHRMDGKKYGTYVIYVQPGEPKDMDDLDVATLDEYIQSAGDADAMVIEIRDRGEAGLRQYAVGRSADEPGSRTVSWAPNYSETVAINEVFTADEAHPVYLQWCWDQTIPDGYRLRLLDI